MEAGALGKGTIVFFCSFGGKKKKDPVLSRGSILDRAGTAAGLMAFSSCCCFL